MIRFTDRNNVPVIELENEWQRVCIAPSLGGKICSVFNKKMQREFLWINPHIPFQAHTAGSEYDPNFIGGIDELLPNDIPESIDGVVYPDHGELWTTPLQYAVKNEMVTVHGNLSGSGLSYSKTVSLDSGAASLRLQYEIRNTARERRHFLWKLHAALIIQKNDRIISPARTGLVVDPHYSRFKKELKPFDWPHIEKVDASLVPEFSDTMDFFYLYDVPSGTMQLHSDDAVFAIDYDVKVFPYQWLFASYGGFMNHYTSILEPCTNMPMLVSDAVIKKQSAFLDPGEVLMTTVRIYAGEKKNYLPANL